jgi:hypothetical protein
LIEYAARNHSWQLDRAALAWLASKPGRKPVSVSGDAAVLRQFYRYLHRSSGPGSVAEPIWPRLPTESSFVPFFLSEKDVLHLLSLCTDLNRPRFRAALYRALILVMYCTGIRLEKHSDCACETWIREPPFFLSTHSRAGLDGFHFIVRSPENWIDTLQLALRSRNRTRMQVFSLA